LKTRAFLLHPVFPSSLLTGPYFPLFSEGLKKSARASRKSLTGFEEGGKK